MEGELVETETGEMKPDFESDDGRVKLYCGDGLMLSPVLTHFDCIITDPPFSERTHAGHDAVKNGGFNEVTDGMNRKVLGYESWGEEEVYLFCSEYKPDGWCVVITDHVLAPFWEKHQSKRYVFAPLPSVTVGRSVRLSGDGPSSWTDWIVVSRTPKQMKWGTLRGAYLNSPQDRTHMGGKPIGLMLALVEDYSRKGDTVCDPCMGAATTGIACLRTGRKFIGVECDPNTFTIAKERIQRELAQLTLPI